jgi:hypothetical protein
MDKYFYMNPGKHDGRTPAWPGQHSCQNCKYGRQKDGAAWCSKYAEELGERRHCVSWQDRYEVNK